MRVCIVSDTHRHRDELLGAVKASQPIDGILHAGDETSDVEWLRDRVRLPIFAVAGNWDTSSAEFPLEQTIPDFGPRVLLIHGHTIRVKDTYEGLVRRAHAKQAKVAVYGHTHVAYLGMQDGILVVNPGSLAQPRGRREKSFATLEIWPTEDGARFLVNSSVFSLQGEVLSQMKVEL